MKKKRELNEFIQTRHKTEMNKIEFVDWKSEVELLLLGKWANYGTKDENVH